MQTKETSPKQVARLRCSCCNKYVREEIYVKSLNKCNDCVCDIISRHLVYTPSNNIIQIDPQGVGKGLTRNRFKQPKRDKKFLLKKLLKYSIIFSLGVIIMIGLIHLGVFLYDFDQREYKNLNNWEVVEMYVQPNQTIWGFGQTYKPDGMDIRTYVNMMKTLNEGRNPERYRWYQVLVWHEFELDEDWKVISKTKGELE